MTTTTRGLLVTLLCAAAALLGMSPASAADTGLLRLAHLSPDTPSVDVYVNSVSDPNQAITLPGVSYGTVSDYQSVPAGTYTVSMRSAGADPSTPPVLSTTVQIEPGSARTVAGVGYFASLGLEILDDSLALPPAGQSRVRVISAAATAPSLDVAVTGGSSVASKLAFAARTDYVDVPGGTTTLQVTGGSGAPTSLPVDLAAGSVYSVIVLDNSDGGLTVQLALDAASPQVVPVGGVETGAGGTAGGQDAATLPLVAGGIAAMAALAVLTTVLLRSPGTHRPRHAATRS
ncbi:DUF4397 domain-containing protein [Modestobacter sp. I12A-02628]|uniref:DUF4397 domain-containing protein n=1 Tax=Goekera deserti TaxID=2497753 RepID=A0A7K3W8U0_9ACTN|nr:DUF4397 domain-containing protein [Goekera deserti]MPQ99956.1 DUF4397 domain-containing protein [Goekera deserti]NDI50114.1 DUF4397 domain-containing protein [Goekera deserti]NEL52409.1 DUF4397 domain-containing protein [Goekera deserti]